MDMALTHDIGVNRRASFTGLWVLLAASTMVFAAFSSAFVVRRGLSDDWATMHKPPILFVNTAVLLLSSLMMAQAVQNAQRGRVRHVFRYLVATGTLGLVFLALKGYEYWSHVHEGLVPGKLWRYDGEHPGPAQIFFWLYYGMTGLHAIHLTIAVGMVAALAVLSRRGVFSAAYHTPVEVIGLYWHLVDIIWVFLFPLFYLVK